MNRENLEGKSIQELRDMAKDMGLKLHHMLGEEKVINAILEASLDAVHHDIAEGDIDHAPAVVKHTAVQGLSKPPVKELATKETLLEALKSKLSNGLQIVEMTKEYFHFKVGVRECAGNMKQPLSTILMQASLLFVPTRAPTEE